eukprot:scpid1149/ scgid19064/ 
MVVSGPADTNADWRLSIAYTSTANYYHQLGYACLCNHSPALSTVTDDPAAWFHVLPLLTRCANRARLNRGSKKQASVTESKQLAKECIQMAAQGYCDQQDYSTSALSRSKQDKLNSVGGTGSLSWSACV